MSSIKSLKPGTICTQGPSLSAFTLSHPLGIAQLAAVSMTENASLNVDSLGEGTKIYTLFPGTQNSI